MEIALDKKLKVVHFTGDDMNNVNFLTSSEKPRPITLSDKECAVDIWTFDLDKKGEPVIKGLYRNGVLIKCSDIGYCKRYTQDKKSYLFIQEQSNIIREVGPSNIKDEAFGYVKDIFEPLEFEYGGFEIIVVPEKLREIFLRQSHTIFNKSFLEHLPTHRRPIVRDDKNCSYFFFENTVVKISEEGCQFSDYGVFDDRCIWSDQIIEHQFEYISDNKDCHFGRFIRNVSNNEEDRSISFQSAIGYLLHNFSHPSKGQAVIAYDEEITDPKNPMGGTGKGLFANAIKQMRDVTKIDGKKFDAHDKFKFQDIGESTQVVWLDDVKPDIGFHTFHSVLTDGWSIEKKHRDQFFIKPEDSPKMLICSNAVLASEGTTNKRRQFILEFSNHYSRQIRKGNEEPIRNEHGCIFFDKDDWDDNEWNKFYSFMLDCVHYYFKNGLQYYSHRNLSKNRLIQATSEEFAEWADLQRFEVEMKYETKRLFEDFKDIFYGENSDFKQRGFTNWIKKLANIREWDLKIEKSNSVNYLTFKVRK